jgi:hypothetical protein
VDYSPRDVERNLNLRGFASQLHLGPETHIRVASGARCGIEQSLLAVEARHPESVGDAAVERLLIVQRFQQCGDGVGSAPWDTRIPGRFDDRQ